MEEWQDRTGIGEPLPMGPWDEWARRVVIDVPAMRAYAQAVYANTDAYLATATMEEWNDGAAHCGETSAVKGLQGLQG